jgi:hypothetical protein
MRSILIAVFLAYAFSGCQTGLGHYDPDAESDAEDTLEDGADTAPDPVDTAPDPVDVTPDPVDIAPDPVDVAPDPVDIAPDPVDVAPDPVDITPDPVDITPDPVDIVPEDVPPDEIPVDVIAEDIPSERPEHCNNGMDDDGDGRIDCMDSDCLLADNCAGTCYPLASISCGSTITGTNLVEGSTDRIIQNSCVTWDSWTGPEVAYQFELAAARRVTITLSGLTADLDLFLMGNAADRCDADHCLARSIAALTDPETITETIPAGTYYILIDGYMDATGPYTLQLSCEIPEICDNGIDDNGLTDCADPDCADRPPCAPSCSPAGTLVCGSSLSGNTAAAGATDVNVEYNCTDYSETGPEFTYSFTTAGGRSVTFTIDTLSTTVLDLFVLEDVGAGCDPFSCIGASTTDDASDSVTITTRTGVTYYVVVDSYTDGTGTYRIAVDCH